MVVNMIDWKLARQIAALTAGNETMPDLGVDFAQLSRDAEGAVADYTNLHVSSLPEGESISRKQWTEINLAGMEHMIGPVMDRAERSLTLGRRASELPDYLMPVLKNASSAVLSAEVGVLLGYFSQRVLGQFELSLLQPDIEPRLLYVAPNLAGAQQMMEVDAESFYRWVALHEVTHVFQFSGVAWLRSYLGDLLQQYLNSVEERLEARARGRKQLPSMQDIITAVRSRDGLMVLGQTREQRLLMEQIQAVMAVIEGYSEHVMDVVGAQVLPSYEGLRDKMESRRAERSAPERLFQRLLGFEAKMRQYEVGKRFCDRVVALGSIDDLNRVWSSPDALPTLAELDDPAEWLQRVRTAGLEAPSSRPAANIDQARAQLSHQLGVELDDAAYERLREHFSN
jgi:coenzyme F420 biosynthesis associated uncharacterized protein